MDSTSGASSRRALASVLQDASSLRRGLVHLAGIQGIRARNERRWRSALELSSILRLPQLHPRHSAAPVKPL